MKTTVFLYVMIINFLTFGIMCLDKYFAQVDAYRVPERWLFFLSLIGGGIGAFVAMRLVRHKTKHWTFVYGIPLCILLNFIFPYPLTIYNVNEWFAALTKFFGR